MGSGLLKWRETKEFQFIKSKQIKQIADNMNASLEPTKRYIFQIYQKKEFQKNDINNFKQTVPTIESMIGEIERIRKLIMEDYRNAVKGTKYDRIVCLNVPNILSSINKQLKDIKKWMNGLCKQAVTEQNKAFYMPFYTNYNQIQEIQENLSRISEFVTP